MKEKLEIVEKAIREALPRLLESTIGCWFKNPKEVGYEKLIGIDGQRYCFDYGDGIYFHSYFPSKFKVIGHDILLNDVLEWFKNLNHETIIVSQITAHGILIGTENTDTLRAVQFPKWDLSKPYLKDQSEELIEFLYNLIQK